MSDQCKNCTLRGDIKGCEATQCFHHENWYPLNLKDQIKQLAELQRENAELKTDFKALAKEEYNVCIELIKLFSDSGLDPDLYDHDESQSQCMIIMIKALSENLNKLRADAIKEALCVLFPSECEITNDEIKLCNALENYANSIEGGE